MVGHSNSQCIVYRIQINDIYYWKLDRLKALSSILTYLLDIYCPETGGWTSTSSLGWCENDHPWNWEQSEGGEWVRSDQTLGGGELASWRGIRYAASWSVSKTIYRPLTRGKHWLSRHPHRVTCRRQTKYFSSPLALPRNILAAACPELGIRYLHPDIVHSHPHQFSRNENSLPWFLRKQQAFKVADAGGGWNRKMVSVNWQKCFSAGMWRVFY